MTQRVATQLMFVGQGSAALELYAATFPQLKIVSLDRYGPNQPGAEGTVKRAEVSLGGHTFFVIDSPVEHAFTFTPSISLFVDCDTAAELDAAFAALSEGGQVLMPIDNYGFSQRFGWCNDRFGVSWQLNCA